MRLSRSRKRESERIGSKSGHTLRNVTRSLNELSPARGICSAEASEYIVTLWGSDNSEANQPVERARTYSTAPRNGQASAKYPTFDTT